VRVGRSREAVKAEAVPPATAEQREVGIGGACSMRHSFPPSARTIDCHCSTVLLRCDWGSRDADASRAEPSAALSLSDCQLRPISFRGGLCWLRRSSGDRRIVAFSGTKQTHPPRPAPPLFQSRSGHHAFSALLTQKLERPGQRQTTMTLTDGCPPTPTDRSPYRSASVASAPR